LLLFTLITAHVSFKCNSQSQYRFQHYDTYDGLASEFVSSVDQDSLGFIWVQYYGGLSRFDGYNFKTYRYNAGDSARSNLNFLIGGLVKKAPEGEIWFSEHHRNPAASFALFRYHVEGDSFVKYALGLQGVAVLRVSFDKNHSTAWLCTDDGLYRYDLNTGSLESYRPVAATGRAASKSNFIIDASDRGSDLIVTTLKGLYVFDKSAKTFNQPQIAPKDTSLLQSSVFGDIIETLPSDADGIWLMHDHGLVQIDEEFRVLKQFSFPKGMFVVACDSDKDGVIWMASQGEGLLRYDPRDNTSVYIRNLADDPSSLRSNFVKSVFVDRNQNIWVGSDLGLSVMRRKSLQFHNVDLKGDRLDASAVYHAPDGDYIWIGQKNPNLEVELKIAKFDPSKPDALQFNSITKPMAGIKVHDFWQGKRHMWVSLYGMGILKFPIDPTDGHVRPESMDLLSVISDNPNSLSTNQTQSIWEDADENLWIATTMSPHGVNKIVSTVPYGSRGSVMFYSHSDMDSSSIASNNIFHLIPQGEDSLWLTHPLGVDLLLEQKKVIHISDRPDIAEVRTMRDGTVFFATSGGLYQGRATGSIYEPVFVSAVGNQECVSMQEDVQGRLWIFNTEGVVCYDRRLDVVVKFNEHDGFLHRREIQDWMANHQTRDGIIVMHDRNGLSIFDPRTFEISKRAINPALVALNVNNKLVSIAGINHKDRDFLIGTDITMLDELLVDYKHNNFSIEFSAMEMTAPEKNLYRHKLEGYDADWIESDYKNRSASYTNLDPGTYTFRVKATNHHGVWSDNERTLKVIILPPPWKTWWAYSIYTVIVLGLLFMARRMIVQRERLKGSLKIAKVEQEKEHFELEKAKEVDRVKTSFFTNISHEFRTPLTLIKGPVETLLARFKDDPDVVQRLKLVQRNSDVLLRLINQLLDLAKLESGTMKIEKSTSDINSLIRAIAGSFESLARHKNVTLSVEIPSDRRQMIFDKDKIETILINLINNAVKFTPSRGEVQVQAVCGDNSLTMIVRDTGFGIPIEHQQKVFERFHQVNEAHKEIGTGIGLSLVKELIQLLQGTIIVSSEPGRGTTFTVMIPLEAGRQTSEPVEELVETLSINTGPSNNKFQVPPSHNGAPERPHVLVVEDNDDLRAFIIDSLGQEFYFLEADNGRKGLEVATTDIPDLIISDVMMPEMDGITMASKIKTDHRSSHIPLILLTAKSTEDSKLLGLRSGADDYLTKPFNRDELLLKVRNSISRQIKLREKLRAEVMGNAPKVEVMSEDERFLVQVKEKILERLSDEQLSVESLAEDIGISRVHLYRKVSGLSGLSVNELIRKLRLRRAAQLLGQHWGPVSQVAYEVGYSNLSYFSKVFKEEFGMLPSEYSEG